VLHAIGKRFPCKDGASAAMLFRMSIPTGSGYLSPSVTLIPRVCYGSMRGMRAVRADGRQTAPVP
jgi:hypothetical protein